MPINNHLIFSLKKEKYLPKRVFLKFDHLVSPYVGIVNAILERKELARYGLKMFQNLSAQVKILFSLPKEIISGGLGVHNNKAKALEICLNESIERYCLAYIPKDELVKSKLSDLPVSNRLKDFFLYSSLQYKHLHKKFKNPEKDSINWIKINSLKNRNKFVYWPASLMYVPYKVEKRVAEQSSSGVAAHWSLDKAILSGLLEMIERDAVAINFLKRLNPFEIDQTTIKNLKVKNIINKLKQEKKNIKIYKLFSNLLAPCFVTIIWSMKDKELTIFHCGIGASCSLDSDVALYKSIKESLFTYFYSKNLLDLKPKNARSIKALYEHLLYYQDKKTFKNLLFNSKQIPYKKERVSLRKVLAIFEQHNLDIYYKDITTPDIVSTGIKVVRVVVPGLVELNSSHALPRKNARRLNDLPKELGLQTMNGLTNLPHPFP